MALTTALAFACFSILAAVNAAKVIISEYCGKNAAILLGYSVNRKAMLGIKCLVVSVITTISAFISNMLVMGGKSVRQLQQSYAPWLLYVFWLIVSQFLQAILSG